MRPLFGAIHGERQVLVSATTSGASAEAVTAPNTGQGLGIHATRKVPAYLGRR
ncbi:hypothetical protein PR003_g5815 [Phytophthora rubi]|uniref:Uncharacterized protein n=1 Tax=Phytophthora rubi TaxID=129364 RepID=A0A6A3NKP5_9STRA|nr:hypothetical protein PR002_g4606 [Phytophthora rubi]KAE9041817.1 hypothetical protein PR001_g6458 [Phytophthora rubi]KAE9349572.1 hypothetical protein PR003_g5815 [Phytophthora rubi]